MKHAKAQISVPESRSFNLKKSVLSPETYKIHSHNNFELNYIVSGWGTRFTGNNIDSFAAGDVKSDSAMYNSAPWDKKITLNSARGQEEAYWAATQSHDGIIFLSDSRIMYSFNLGWLINGY